MFGVLKRGGACGRDGWSRMVLLVRHPGPPLNIPITVAIIILAGSCRIVCVPGGAGILQSTERGTVFQVLRRSLTLGRAANVCCGGFNKVVWCQQETR